MNHKLFATLSSLSVCSALLIVGLVAPEPASGLGAASGDNPLVETLQAGVLEDADADAVAKPAQRQSRHKRGSLSMPYFSFAQSLRPRG